MRYRLHYAARLDMYHIKDILSTLYFAFLPSLFSGFLGVSLNYPFYPFLSGAMYLSQTANKNETNKDDLQTKTRQAKRQKVTVALYLQMVTSVKKSKANKRTQAITIVNYNGFTAFERVKHAHNRWLDFIVFLKSRFLSLR